VQKIVGAREPDSFDVREKILVFEIEIDARQQQDRRRERRKDDQRRIDLVGRSFGVAVWRHYDVVPVSFRNREIERRRTMAYLDEA